MVTFWVIKLIPTCSTMRGQLFHTVASTDFEWLLWPIIIYVTLNLLIVSKSETPNTFIHKSEWLWISHKNHFLQGSFLFSACSDKWVVIACLWTGLWTNCTVETEEIHCFWSEIPKGYQKSVFHCIIIYYILVNRNYSFVWTKNPIFLQIFYCCVIVILAFHHYTKISTKCFKGGVLLHFKGLLCV